MKVERDRIFSRDNLIEIVLSGVPSDLRHRLWTIICNLDHLKAKMVKEHKNLGIKNPKELYHHYRNKRDFEAASQVSRDLNRDINRSFFKDDSFSKPLDNNENPLFNVLNAYAHLDKEIGYKTNMHNIASCLLLTISSEEDCFYFFTHIMRIIGWRDCFIGMQAESKTAEILGKIEMVIEFAMPDIIQHIDDCLNGFMHFENIYLSHFEGIFPK